MEEIEEISDHSKGTECIASIDANFCLFYYKAVKRLLDIESKANVSYLYRYAKIFNKYYDIFGEVRKEIEDQDDVILKLLESSLYYRLIYFYRNATLFSSVAAFHFQNVYKQNPSVIKRVINKKTVKICSIGGCSVSGIVAIITVLKSVVLEIGVELDFRVTIIDTSAEWENASITVLSCLEEFQKATWKINFIQCNISKTWTPELLKTIQEADVITIVRFISDLEVKQNIIQVISDNLKTEGILFILDHPYAKLIELYFGITNLGDFHLLHAELCDYHTLDIEAVKQFRTLYKKHFGDEKLFKCNVSANMFVSVWLNVSSENYAKYKDNVECIFLTNAEKSDLKPSFLNHDALTKWENLFRKKKEAAGWSAKSIQKFVNKQKGKRSDMFGKYINQKKGLNSLQNHFLNELQYLEMDRKQFNEISKQLLNRYLSRKSQHSFMKKEAYFSLLSAHNLCSFFE